ncbi:MAG TPA: ABC transporter permease [Thermomicrobiales bacterium]|nr:ABC transporter permease [Thermomicrobiales bacterium]
MSQLPLTADAELKTALRRPSRIAAFWRPFVASRMGPIGLAILIIVALAAIFAPVLAPDGPFKLGAPRLLAPGEQGHLLGTDHLGRDVFAQIVYGARVSLSIGLVAASISLVVGVIVGSIAGYFGGFIDLILSRMTDMFLIIPAFFLIIVVVATLGSGITYVMIVIGLTAWPTSARLMRAQAMTLRERTFIQALKALGESSPRILLRHIIPNGIQPLIANASLDIASAILIEAGLSFLGLGDPNKATWGRMIFDGRTTILTAWWSSVFPGVAIIITVLGFYLVGDGISYVLSPRNRKVSA